MTLNHQSQAKSKRNISIILTIYAVLLAAIYWLDASYVIAGFVALFTLPALYEIATNRQSGLTLDAHSLCWFSGKITDSVPVLQIEKIRFDTRLDLSVRVTLYLKNGQRIRLPHACVPPRQKLQNTAEALGIATERHHFSLIGG